MTDPFLSDHEARMNDCNSETIETWGAVRGAGSRAPGGAAPLCATSGRRPSDPALELLRDQEDRPGGRVRCLRCGRQLVLVQGPWLRAVAPPHPAHGSDR